MRALTLWQPHATLMALGVKRWETRSWKAPASLLGHPLAIHAGLGMDLEIIEECILTAEALGHLAEDTGLIPRGGIVAVVLLTDCRETTDCDRYLGSRHWMTRKPQDFGDYSEGRYVWETKLLLVCKPHIVCRGYQGVWNVPANIAAVLQEKLDSEEGRKRLKKVASF